jgi:hypothetical protein
MTGVAHDAVHRLAMRVGCACPDCDCARRGAARFEEDFDYAAPRRRPAPRPRRPFPQTPRPTPAMRRALQSTVRSLGWTGWRQPRGAAPNMQQLADFQRARGVRRVPGSEQLAITPQGRRLLQSDPRFRALAPLFSGPRGQQIYEIAPPGQPNRPMYVGKTGRAPGLRVLEHLNFGRDRAHAELVAAQRAGTLGQLQVAQGRFTAPDLGRRSHLGEVALMELLNPAWNDPRRHGFDAAAPSPW